MEPTKIENGRALVLAGKLDEAIQELSEALNDEFYNDEALFMLGGCLIAKGMNGLGAVITSAAVDTRAADGLPFPEALLNLGAAYKSEHQNERARRVWDDALRHETLPVERAKILTNMAGLYVNEGCPEKAIPLCDRALAEDPKCDGARANRAMAHLELKHWRRGWQDWKATLRTGDRHPRTYPDIPAWDGSPDKKVIVWGDQGIGDEIFYAECLRDMITRCDGKVILDCHPRLTGLFKRSFPDIEVYGTRKDLTEPEWLRNCGAQAAIGMADLPGIFRNSAEDWSRKQYLQANPHLMTGPKPRIGLSWYGGTKKTRRELRSMSLEALIPAINAQPEAQWFSLQYTEDAAREVCELEERTGIRISHFPGYVECFDYDRTASFVAGLDLVITVCTTIHHLGGALGIPTWTLVPKRASWRYGVSGEESPWYGSVRLFRQEQDGVWNGPIQKVARELANLS